MASSSVASLQPTVIRTSIPARLDRLPWSRFHTLVIVALGITWILDGLQVSMMSVLGSALREPVALGLSESQVGLAATMYLGGAIIGSLIFGHLADLWGRKKLFVITLAVYLCGTLLTAFSWNLYSFALFQFITGMGIGGEYSAINSAINELLPAHVRGRTALAINGSYWVGAAMGGYVSSQLLQSLGFALGWRVAFGLGALLGLIIIVLRKWVPESPRWLMTHGRVDEAEAIVREIERGVEARHGKTNSLWSFVRRLLGRRPAEDVSGYRLPAVSKAILIRAHERVSFAMIARTLVRKYPARTVLGLALMISQAFFYNAIFFTYGLILSNFYGIRPESVGNYIVPFAIGNFLGPIFLGPLFDKIGRKQLISITYAVSAVLLAITGYLFKQDLLTANTQVVMWSVIFFVASAAASSAYLTVGEIFPLEMRGLAIALFYSVGTGVGGLFAPYIFGRLIQSGSREQILYGYLFGATLMVAAAGVEMALGVKAEGQSLEDVAEPLTSSGTEGVQGGQSGRSEGRRDITLR